MNTALAQQQRDRKISAWFTDYGKRLLRFIRSRVDDLEAAEDVAQDVWYQLTRQEDLDEIRQIGSWLFTAANRRIINLYKRRKTLPFSRLEADRPEDAFEEEEEDSNLSFQSWVTDNLPDELVETDEFWSVLYAALDRLPAEQREVFVAHELYDIPFKELAAESGLSVNTLLSRKRYAVLYLREVFEDYLSN